MGSPLTLVQTLYSDTDLSDVSHWLDLPSDQSCLVSGDSPGTQMWPLLSGIMQSSHRHMSLISRPDIWLTTMAVFKMDALYAYFS